MATDRSTPISAHAFTLRMIRPLKKGDTTWDDVLAG